jgi:hypothetical protein
MLARDFRDLGADINPRRRHSARGPVQVASAMGIASHKGRRKQNPRVCKAVIPTCLLVICILSTGLVHRILPLPGRCRKAVMNLYDPILTERRISNRVQQQKGDETDGATTHACSRLNRTLFSPCWPRKRLHALATDERIAGFSGIPAANPVRFTLTTVQWRYCFGFTVPGLISGSWGI